MWFFFLNEMEKNLRNEPYFSLKFWEKIFLILKTKIDWIVIIIQNKKNKKKILFSLELSLSILYERDFGLTSLHKGTKKNPNSGYISTIFFHYHVMCDFTKKVRWQRRITTVNDKIDAFLFHYFYFQKIDRKKTNQAT